MGPSLGPLPGSEQAKTIFSQYGSVKSTNVLPVSPGKTAAACFVLMETVEDAKWIVEHAAGFLF